LPPIAQIGFWTKAEKETARAEASRQIQFIQRVWSEYMKNIYVDNGLDGLDARRAEKQGDEVTSTCGRA
jgi:hypothetical protein